MMQDSALRGGYHHLWRFALSFIMIAALASAVGIQIDRQLDFWLLWLGTMVILALPLCYLEIALAKRSKTTALNALSSLTRDADASQKWRIVGWLAVVFIPFWQAQF
jgi:cytochrome c biogenesis protein CcdA